MAENLSPSRDELIADNAQLRRQVMELAGADVARVQAEAALRVAEQRFRVYVDNAPEAIFVANESGRFVDVNAAACDITGYSAAELSRMTMSDLAPREDQLPSGVDHIDSVRQTGSGQGEYPIVRRDGGIVWLSMRAAALDQGRVLAFCRDVTERRNAEERRVYLETQMQQAQKLESLGVLAGGIAHDFNNLLMGILGNAGLALMDVQADTPAHAPLLGIEAAALRAKDLTSQMLAYSGRGRFIVEVVELPQIIEGMMNLLEVSISKNVVQTTDFCPQTPPVEADVTQLRQIIMNLVTNASEAIGNRSGMIGIATAAMHCDRAYLQSTYLDDDLSEGTYTYLEVTDTGAGMDPSTVKRMFEPFFTTKFSGRGLGLAAVLGIVRGHHGAIKVLSVPNQGTTIRVLFPAADPADLRRREPSSENLAVGRGGTVLLVDDEETVRLVGGQMLRRLGYDVVTANDGREALEIYRQDPSRFDCVMLDQTMPHMGGKECLRRLRELTPNVRVILSSGYTEQELEDRYADEQIEGYIQKPYLPADLAKLLNKVLG